MNVRHIQDFFRQIWPKITKIDLPTKCSAISEHWRPVQTWSLQGPSLPLVIWWLLKHVQMLPYCAFTSWKFFLKIEFTILEKILHLEVRNIVDLKHWRARRSWDCVSHLAIVMYHAEQIVESFSHVHQAAPCLVSQMPQPR